MGKWVFPILISLSVLCLSACGKEEEKNGTPANQMSVSAPEVLTVLPSIPTNNNSPVVSGTAAEFVQIKLYSNSTCTTLIGIGNSLSDGTFSVSATVADDSTTTIYATAHNGNYHSSCSSTFVTYYEDSGPPDEITFTGTDPVSPSEETSAIITGEAEALSTVRLYEASDCTGPIAYSTTANSSGEFSVNITVLENSTNTFYGLARDAAGNLSDCSGASVEYVHADMTAPAMPVVLSILPVGPANNNSPVVSGTAEANTTVNLYLENDCSGASIGDAVANGAGNFSITPTIDDDSVNTIYATATDAASNVSSCSVTSVSYTEDSTAPNEPVFTGTTPASPSESFTTTIAGTAEVGTNVKLYTANDCTGAVAHNLTTNGSGDFSVAITVAANSTTTYYATATDAGGNISPCTSSPVTYTQADLTPPPMPIVLAITPVGPSDINTPVVNGTAEANSTIKAYTNNTCTSSVVGTGTTNVVGDYTVSVNSINNTSTTYWVTASDANGNESSCSSTSIAYTSYSIPEGIGWFTGATTTTAPSTNTNINQATAYALRFTASEYHSTYFAHSTSTNPHQVTVKVAGDYLINYTIPYTAATAGTSVRAEVRVNGVIVDTGRGESGYISNASSAHRESSLHSTILLPNLNANDVIDVTTIKAGAVATATISGTASLGIEYIESTRNIFFAKGDQTTNSTNLNQATSYPMQWTNSVIDGIYAHSNSTNNQEITINSNGHYLAYINIPMESATAQTNVKMIVKLNGITIPYSNASQGIIRGTTHLASSLHWFGLIPNVSSGAILTVETAMEATAGTVTVPSGRKASIYLEQVPATGLYVARGNTLVTNNNWNNSTTGQNVKWTNVVLNDATYFSHSTVTNPDLITMLQDGDYMVVTNNPMTSATVATNVASRILVNNVAVTGAEAKCSYVSATGSHSDTSNALAFLLRKRAANQNMSIRALRESNAGTVSSNGDSLLILRYRPNSTTP